MLSRILFFGMIIGPWPVDQTSVSDQPWYQSTGHRLDTLDAKASRGPFDVGVAQIALTPSSPVPVAGFIGQIMLPYESTSSSCSARALTIATQSSTLTIVAVDLLLISERMTQRILAKTGLARDQVYFTATHTHGGPGAWGNHPLERLVSGSFDPAFFDFLVERIAHVIIASRMRLESAEMAFVQTGVDGLQRNRIVPGQPTNNTLSAWIFRASKPSRSRQVLATLAVFGSHATLSHHPDSPQLSGDYPRAFEEALHHQVDAGVVLFAAGTVGDSSPIRFRNLNQRQNLEAHGKILTERLAESLRHAEFHAVLDLVNLGLVIDLPPVQVPFGLGSLRFSPFFCWWISKRATYLHVVKLGPAVLVGFPGDFSSHLNTQLHGSFPIVATSFNGDYKGYLVSKNTFFAHPCYETRWMSFFGPFMGDYLTNMAKLMIELITDISYDKDGAKTSHARL